MSRIASLVFLLSCLGGCAGTSPAPRQLSACATQPGGWDCQIERYSRVGGG